MMGDESNFGQGDSSHFFFLKDWYDTIVPHAFPADQKRSGTRKDFQKPAESNRKMISRSLEDHQKKPAMLAFYIFISLNSLVLILK
jgi:hypothetical protein